MLLSIKISASDSDSLFFSPLLLPSLPIGLKKLFIIPPKPCFPMPEMPFCVSSSIQLLLSPQTSAWELPPPGSLLGSLPLPFCFSPVWLRFPPLVCLEHLGQGPPTEFNFLICLSSLTIDFLTSGKTPILTLTPWDSSRDGVSTLIIILGTNKWTNKRVNL